MPRPIPLRGASERAFEAFIQCCPEGVAAAGMVPAPVVAPGTAPGAWSASRDEFGRVAVLLIGLSSDCPSVERAGCVVAMARLGVRTLVLLGEGVPLTAVAESAGLVGIDDHINLLGDNPLIGPHDPAAGPRFPDMSEAYSHRLRQTVCAVGAYPRGVYAACSAESLASEAFRSELARLGAHVAGPWLAPEVIAARHAAMEVLAFTMPLSANYGIMVDRVQESETAYRNFKEVSTRVLETIRT